jgi:lipopolysaccharide export LptBFGC system permease protein LptF
VRPGEAALARRGEIALAVASPVERRSDFGTREYAEGLSANVRRAKKLRGEFASLERGQLEAAVGLGAAVLAGGAASGETVSRLEGALAGADRSRSELARRTAELRRLEMEIHRKLSVAFAPLALAFLGIPLGLRLGRGGRLAGFAVGIAAIAFVYYPIWISGQGLAASGALPAGPAVWAAPALVGGCGAAWLSRMV